MRGVRRGQEISCPKSHDLLGPVMRGINDQIVCWSGCLTDAVHQSLSPMSTNTRRRLWIDHKARQNRLRRLATGQGVPLGKFSHRVTGTPGVGAFALTTATTDAGGDDGDLLMCTANHRTLDNADESFLDQTTRGEVITYLHHAYGSGLVNSMVKHLSHPRCR